jgi:hypothetical protein
MEEVAQLTDRLVGDLCRHLIDVGELSWNVLVANESRNPE